MKRFLTNDKVWIIDGDYYWGFEDDNLDLYAYNEGETIPGKDEFVFASIDLAMLHLENLRKKKSNGKVNRL